MAKYVVIGTYTEDAVEKREPYRPHPASRRYEPGTLSTHASMALMEQPCFR